MYTVLLGFFLDVVLTFAGFALVPQIMRYHPRSHPVGTGIAMGCGIPMIFMVLYHLAQRKQKQAEHTP